MKRIAKRKEGPSLRTFLPLMVAAACGTILLIVLAIYLLTRPPVQTGPSQQELAADYAKGLQYERGDGVTMDYLQAINWYRKAADAGYPPAELGLGIMYMAGRGVAKDEKQAVTWFRRAAEHGLPEAQVQLAGDTLSGLATADGKPDQVEALKWLLLGAEAMADPLTRQVAITTRDSLTAQLAPEQRDEAAKRAADWRKQHAPAQ